MKAQSDLTGDRERAAEMTAPCASRVTAWMDRIKTACKGINSFATEGKTLIDSIAPKFEIPDIGEISYNTEVNYCPARQQCLVCTP